MNPQGSSNGASVSRKANAYAKRHSASISAPIEFDSDSEFAAGPVIEPVKEKRKKKTKKATTPRATAGSSKALFFSTNRKKASRRVASSSEHNPLLEFFAGESIELQSASEGEDDVFEERPDPGSEADEDGEDDADVSRLSQPRAPPVKPPLDDSATESDSEPEPQPALKRKSRSPSVQPCKRQKIIGDSATESDPELPAQEPEDDSATESDPVDEVPLRKLSHTNVPGKQKATPEDDDSATESEGSDYDHIPKNAVIALNPKPGFPLVPGQPKLGPLVLDKETGIEVPEPLCIHLRGYQREGVSFLYRQYKEGLGALLGDDMGLGKTIQVIAFLSAIMKKTGTALDEGRRHHYVSNLQDARSWRKTGKLQPANTKWPTCLIIAPSTVVHNWEREFQTWGYFEVGIYTGTPKDRETTLRDFKLGRLDVLVTSFDIARKDIDLLDDLALSCVIVDEVHRVKNDSSQITNAFHRFACTVRMGLTGTTVQNSYKEMWTILDWTNPGKLGTARQWNGYVVKPLTVGQSSAATPEQTVRAAAVARVLKEKLLPKFFLRRTKDIIRDQLPKKTDQVVFCPLTRAQISAYKNILEMEEVQNLIKRDQPCDCGSRKSSKTCCHPFEAAHVFKYMSILIKLSNHLVLILPGGPKDTADQTATNRALARVAFPDGRVPKYGTAILEEGFCGKWGTLNVLLREWRVDTTNKVLIFTKSVKLLEALEFHLNARSYRFLKLDGSTKQSERMPMIDRFNNDPEVFIFLISTLAGGTGLNLTGANKVVIFDPNWNPAHDLQAMDRAFRFGQRRDVSVYRLLGAGSVEELIYARQIYKQQQMAIAYDASFQTRYFEGIQGDVTKRGELFGLENIFKLQEDKWATQMAIEKANLAELDWALTNLKGAKGKRASNKELLEAEAKVGKEDSTVKGLARLLFEDDLPEVKETEEDKITKSLNAIGVKYSHMNDKILRPSKVEEERTKQTIRKKRVNKAKVAEGSGKGDGDSDGKKEEPKVWPPVRNRKRKLDAVDSLSARREALIALGLISSPAELTKFAGEFSKQTLEEQQSIIAILDKWVVDNADELGR